MCHKSLFFFVFRTFSGRRLIIRRRTSPSVPRLQLLCISQPLSLLAKNYPLPQPISTNVQLFYFRLYQLFPSWVATARAVISLSLTYQTHFPAAPNISRRNSTAFVIKYARTTRNEPRRVGYLKIRFGKWKTLQTLLQLSSPGMVTFASDSCSSDQR